MMIFFIIFIIFHHFIIFVVNPILNFYYCSEILIIFMKILVLFIIFSNSELILKYFFQIFIVLLNFQCYFFILFLLQAKNLFCDNYVVDTALDPDKFTFYVFLLKTQVNQNFYVTTLTIFILGLFFISPLSLVDLFLQTFLLILCYVFFCVEMKEISNEIFFSFSFFSNQIRSIYHHHHLHYLFIKQIIKVNLVLRVTSSAQIITAILIYQQVDVILYFLSKLFFFFPLFYFNNYFFLKTSKNSQNFLSSYLRNFNLNKESMTLWYLANDVFNALMLSKTK